MKENSPNLLLTSVFKPFGSRKKYSKLNGRHSLCEMYRGQIMISQDIFQLESSAQTYGLDLIAKNSGVKSTVLHFPSLKEFKKELKMGNYTHVGINFVISTFEKAKVMAIYVRNNYPDTKIIFGGYGTVLPQAKDYCDYLCRGEGVSYIRNLFSKPKIKKYKMPNVRLTQKMLGFSVGDGSMILGSIGCINGCEFCATSHFLDYKVHYFLPTGKDLFNEVKRIYTTLNIKDVAVIDEDFLVDKKRILEFSRLMGSSDIDASISCFASIKSLTQYDIIDLVKAGISSIWIGVESPNSDFPKNKNFDIPKIIRELQSNGISVLGSMILGLDQHTKKNLNKEFEDFLKLHTDSSQFSIYSPSNGTKLWSRLKKEKRLRKFNNTENDGFSLLFDHPHFSKKYLENLLYTFFDREYYVLGPSVFRYIRTKFKGYNKFKKSKDKTLTKISNSYKSILLEVLPILKIVSIFHKNKRIKNEALHLRKDIIAEFKPQINITKLYTLELILLSTAIIKKYILPRKIYYNPKLIRNVYSNE